jgi:hypothetical protein
MADALYSNARLISGDPGAKRISPTVATEIKAGEHVVLVSSKAKRPSSLADSGTTAQNQEAAHDIYLGVALDQSLVGESKDILVASRGEFKFPCAALGQAYDVGAYFGLEGTGTAAAVGVHDINVVPVATANLAVGRLSRGAASGATEVYIEIAGVATTPFAGTQALA